MNLEKHAKALLSYKQDSDDDDQFSDYKMKALKYRKDCQEAEETIEKLRNQNTDQKQIIQQLLDDMDIHRKRTKLLEQELLNQQQLSQDAIQQLRKTKQQKQEDRLFKEQKEFQSKLTLQSTEAIEKLRQHFDQTLSQITPKTNKSKK